MFTLLGCIATISCNSQQKKASDIKKTYVTVMDTTVDILKILKKQIAAGNNVEGGYHTNAEDVNATFPLIDSILLANGYKKPSEVEFKQKVKKVLGFTDEQCKKEGLPFYIADGWSKCELVNWNQLYNLSLGEDNGVTNFVFYISFKYQLIAPIIAIPLLIDYQKRYPQITQYEDGMPATIKGSLRPFLKWKDEKSLIGRRQANAQYLMGVNAYLFNGSKAYVPYLIHTDPNLVEGLVKEYGYTKEPSFNKSVLEKYSAAANTDPDAYNSITIQEEGLKNFGETIFKRDCEKQLSIRIDLLDYIAQHTDTSDTKMAVVLNHYVYPLFENGGNTDFHKTFTKSERRKILAYAACAFDPYLFKHPIPGTNNLPREANKSIMGLTLYFDPTAEQEYKLHKYYGNPNLEALVNIVKKNAWNAPN